MIRYKHQLSSLWGRSLNVIFAPSASATLLIPANSSVYAVTVFITKPLCASKTRRKFHHNETGPIILSLHEFPVAFYTAFRAFAVKVLSANTS